MHTLDNHGAGEIRPDGQPTSEQKQARLMRMALGLLLTALVVVAAKDWGFWSEIFFPEEQVAETVSSQPAPQTTASSDQATQPKTMLPYSKKSKSKHATPYHAARAETVLSPVVTTSSRRVLPPLEIDVVAGNKHQTVQASKRSVTVDMQGPAETVPATPSSGEGIVPNASDRVIVSSDASSVVARQVEPNYPVLAKQMKVQGAVILQALIGKNGNIQDLHVLSGPAILSEAARQAVKQWHFKPYLLAGQAVETEARITVNFTISTD